ncbi:MAG: radical SAM protein [Chitinophagales bacterium]|nr:radical SAM protein [Chitinophagales bacterium]
MGNFLTKIFKSDPVNYNLSKASKGITKKILRDYNQHRPLGPQKYICHAPFKSIYLGHHGRAIACCYNRTYFLGSYPENSIRDIWFGEKANELREAIKNNDLSKGCNSCLTQIAAYNFDATKAKQYDHSKFNENLFPSTIEFELDNTCNLECVMCSGDYSSLIRTNREKREPLKSPYDDNFLEQLKEFIPYLEEVKFYGGEPFLIETYYKIWEMLMKMNPSVRISVQTNATILNNRVKNILAKTNFHIGVSLDSLQKEVYEKIRINANFDRVMENIDFFYKYCKERNTFFGISACMLRDNWKEMPDFIRFCNERSIPVYFHTIFFPLDRSIHSLEINELDEIICHYENHLSMLPEKTPIEGKNKNHLNDAVNQVKKWRMLASERSAKQSQITIHAKSIEELILLLNNGLQGKVKTNRIQKVTEVLTTIKKELPDDFDYTSLFKTINLAEDDALSNMLIDLETKPLHILLNEAKEMGKRARS